MQESQKIFNQELLKFLDLSPTPFHAVSQIAKILKKSGFRQLGEGDKWNLKTGGKYYAIRNGSSLVAFIAGQSDPLKTGFRIVGAHTDSPCLMVKPNPDITKNGYLQLGIEVYGGALLNPWFDRDLSIAGRIIFQTLDGRLEKKLIDFQRPICIIPSLAIHLDRGANKNRSINAQKDLPPIVMKAKDDRNFSAILEDEFLSSEDSIVDSELSLYDCQHAAILGINDEFLVSARLDNLLSCYVGAKAISSANEKNNCILVCSDHEEVGSVSSSGADGSFLESVLRRMVGNETTQSRIMSQSLFMSCDSAHAMHPNFKSAHDDMHEPMINGGPVIKVNVKQRYATSSLTSGFFRKLCADAGIPLQTFVSRSDVACGSTIGPIVASKLGIPTLDIGIPQLAMHSCRETAGIEDPVLLAKGLAAFFGFDGSLVIKDH